MKISKEQVFAVADGFVATNQKLTLAAVRQAIGGGSYTTISQLVAEWRAQHQAKQAPLQDPVPSTVSARLSDLGAEIWAAALAHAKSRFEVERKSLEDACARFQEQMNDALGLAEGLTAEIDEVQEKLASMEKKDRAMQKDMNELREQINQASALANESDIRQSELQKRVMDLNAELTRVNEQNGQLIQRFGSPQTC